ncbi:MAG: hypothetical protein EHM51_00250 [Geobacter sp.]|nr:MAG: hypothetical protein EHM51_00250 [Geobacter sp.]
MSFILKALKKLEQEKAERRPGPADLETAILSGGRSRESAPRLFKWSVIVITFIAGGGLMYLLMHAGPGKSNVSQNQAVVADVPTAVHAPVAASAPQPAATGMEPGRPTAPQEEALRGGSVPVRPRLQKPPEAASTSRRNVRADVPLTSPAPQEADAPPPAGIKVNGIALQDDPGESVAVINGALFKKGMSVEGARLEEIFHDRVKFSGRGGTFQVQLSK